MTKKRSPEDTDWPEEDDKTPLSDDSDCELTPEELEAVERALAVKAMAEAVGIAAPSEPETRSKFRMTMKPTDLK